MCMKTNSLLSQTCSVYCLLHLIFIIFPALQANTWESPRITHSCISHIHSSSKSCWFCLYKYIQSPTIPHHLYCFLPCPLISLFTWITATPFLLNESFSSLTVYSHTQAKETFKCIPCSVFPLLKTILHAISRWTDSKGLMIVCNILCNLFPL